jgi:hypothetical protein
MKKKEAVKMKGNIKSISKSIALALGITMLSPIYGKIHIITNHDAPKSEVATFSQFGVSNEKAEIRKGFADDMPLETAIEIIVPEGWKVTTNNNALDELVQWEGGVTWPYVLENLSASNDISVSINWNDRTIDMFSHLTENKRMAAVSEQEEVKNLFNEAQKDVENQIALKTEKELRSKYEIEKKMLEKEISDKKEAEIANSEYIASLESEKDKLIEMGDELSTLIEEKNNIITEKEDILTELTSNNTVLNDEIDKLKYENVSTNGEDFVEVNIEALKKDYRGKFVLPIDDSFEFYYQGGYEEEYDYYTPATYIVKGNITLQENLQQWVNTVGWSMEWKTTVRYPIKYPAKFEGTFKESSLKLINLYRDSKRPLDIDFYPDSKVVVVTDLTHKIKNK